MHRFHVLEASIKTLQPLVVLGECAPLLFDVMSCIFDLRSCPESEFVVLAGFISVHLICDHDIANFDVLYASGNANEQRHTRSKIRNCALSNCCGACVAGAYLGYRNIPRLELALIKDSAVSSRSALSLDVSQHSFRLDIKCGQDHG